MPRSRVGPDEIRFAEGDRVIAETLARLLPEIRRKGEDIAGLVSPSIRFIVANRLPSLFSVLRPTWPVAAICGAAPAAMGAFAALAFDPSAAIAMSVSLMATGPVYRLWKGMRQARMWWPHCGGLTFGHPGWWRPTIVLHYPIPPHLPVAEGLCYPSPSADLRLSAIAAHEYGHALLQTAYGRQAVPTWLSEGFSFWLAEQIAGQPLWRPESNACVEEPEPKGSPYDQFGTEAYYRLAARHYWEVRSLADRGLLRDALSAPLRRASELRPQLRVP